MKSDLTLKKKRSSTRLFIWICLIMIVSGVCTLGMLHWRLKEYAKKEAKTKAMAILDRNLAIHTFYSHQLKPALFETLKPVLDKEDFQPVWMSSTFAVREIDKYFQTIAPEDYYYKECAVNARSPENEADAFERDFIRQINASTDITEISAVRTLGGQPFFVVLRRGEVMEQSCMRCHSTPDKAPADMVKSYGPDRSFNRSVGDVVSAISIRIPLAEAFGDVNRLMGQVFILFCLTILAVFGFSVYLSNRWLFSPLETIRMKAVDICEHPDRLGDTIDLPKGYELSELTGAFNALSTQLRKERDLLEERVDERTTELNEKNASLSKAVSDLKQALNEIKTLKGILPICSHCNKIRDDYGDWNRLESYITKHSDADFSHSVCPDCAKRHYPDLDIYDE